MEAIINKLEEQVRFALSKENLSVSELYDLTKIARDLKEIKG